VQLYWREPSEFPTLCSNDVHVWAVPLERLRASATELESVLSPDERARAAGFALERPRHVFVASRAALRSILGSYLDLSPDRAPIVTDPSGKPRLADGDLRFNLAHSGNLTLIAVTRGCEIGVDVELLRPVDRSHEIAARNFHPVELAAVLAADDNENAAAELPAVFMRCWTRKEAVLKAVGVGLGYPLDAFDTLTQASDGDWVDLPAHALDPAVRCWLQDVRPCRDYAAAVAVLEPRQPPLGFTYSL
jgi:4'-phosphopantetheinyl transferase